MRIRLSGWLGVGELQQVNARGVLVIAQAQMHPLERGSGHAEGGGHFRATHTLPHVKHDLKAEPLVERQGALKIGAVDVEVEDSLDHAAPLCQGHHSSNTAVRPPSTKSCVPVIKEASSLARNAAACPMSSGVPIRFI